MLSVYVKDGNCAAKESHVSDASLASSRVIVQSITVPNMSSPPRCALNLFEHGGSHFFTRREGQRVIRLLTCGHFVSYVLFCPSLVHRQTVGAVEPELRELLCVLLDADLSFDLSSSKHPHFVGGAVASTLQEVRCVPNFL